RAAARREAAAAIDARHAERTVLARELHDIVAHSVSVMAWHAATARDAIAAEPRQAAESLEVIQDVGKQSMDELRRLLHLLRTVPGEEADAITHPGLDSLDQLVAQSRAAGLPVEVEGEGEPARLDPSVGTAAYRLVQEALTNTRQHAGPRAHAAVRVVWGADRVTLTVDDTGTTPATGFHPGHGLGGLRERVTAVGGELTAGPTATGFEVKGVLPTARQRTTASRWRRAR
ncbi:histidine kinase, partial [Actinoplanes sp. NPDC005259]